MHSWKECVEAASTITFWCATWSPRVETDNNNLLQAVWIELRILHEAFKNSKSEER